jgi:hypothetical protein
MSQHTLPGLQSNNGLQSNTGKAPFSPRSKER